MKLPEFSFSAVNWEETEPVEHKGETGKAVWRTKYLGDIRIRMVEYSENYTADHWCSKGHILHIIKGEMVTELQDGRKFLMTEGMSYIVGDDTSSHRSSTEKGAQLLIVD